MFQRYFDFVLFFFLLGIYIRTVHQYQQLKYCSLVAKKGKTFLDEVQISYI